MKRFLLILTFLLLPGFALAQSPEEVNALVKNLTSPSAAKRAALGRAIHDDAAPVLTAEDFAEARRRIPLSITDAILAPYRKFMEERF